MNVKIVQVAPEDIDLLMEWRMEVLSTVFSDWDKENEKELYRENLKYYQSMLESGQHIAVFAEANGQKIGCGGLCIYQEMPSPDNPNGYCGYLMNIYTREAYRGQGIGEAVVSYLLDCAKKSRIEKVYLETSESGRRLYEKMGFTDMVDYMKLEKVDTI